MRRAAAAGVLLLGLVAPAALADGEGAGSVPVAAAEGGHRWFVELASPPTADGTAEAVVKAEKAAFRAQARKAGVAFTERFAFDTLWNGLSIDVDPSRVATLARIDGVKAVYPVEAVARPEPGTIDPELATALAMTGADNAQSELGYTGRGVRVAVMDTGVDYDHADLGGDGVARGDSDRFPNARVVAGWDLVGDTFNFDRSSHDFNPVPSPDPRPDDCGGHGTHVAGIVGASGAVTGVAPGAELGSYRVFGCAGPTSADIMIEAMERALADRMDVLNMSIGSAFAWPNYPTAAASDRLVNRGMVVVASIGNSGASGLYAASAPGVGKKVIGVASFDNSHINLQTFTVSPDDAPIGYGPAAGVPAPPGSGSLDMARTGTTSTTNDACSPLAAGSLAGKAVLIRRGFCTFHTKAFHAQSAGAAAVVIYNNVPGRFGASVAGNPPITIPVVAISDTDGALIDSRLAGGPVTLTWTAEESSFANPTGGLISSFSSYGLAPDLSLKPDLGAPGGLIRSTYPLESGGYGTLSGTSMAAPHTAGAVALLLEARPRTPAQAVRAILQNSAEPKPWWGNPALGFLDNVHRQGAGMVQIDRAITATTRIEPGALALGESEAGPHTRTLTVENAGPVPVTYSWSHQGALATGSDTFSPSFVAAFATVAFDPPSVVVPPGASAAVQVTITAPGVLQDRGIYGGYLVATPDTGGHVHRVPYAGLKGDYQSITALTPTANGFPWLARLAGGSYHKQGDGASFTMAGADIPFLLVHLDHQVRRFRVEVFDHATGKAWHRAADWEYEPRNSTASSFFAAAIDGTTSAGKKTYTLPDGRYVLRLSVQKALGDDGNPAHWETWTSPSFVIARP